MSPAVITLLMWMIIPLGMTIYFSLIRYNLMQPDRTGFVGWQNYEFFVTNPALVLRYSIPLCYLVVWLRSL